MSHSIAKNTFYLYIRMFLTMGVSLYTSRLILEVLGVVDYGIYSVVGGLVLLLGFFNSAMTNATQRFLAIEIGKNNMLQLERTFNSTIIIHIVIAILILILAETFGYWYVEHKLNIPQNRHLATTWVYQISVLTFLINVIRVPFDALIIAHENMKIYAILSIFEAFLKLAIVLSLLFITNDKLISYSVLMFFVTLLVASSYITYTLLKYKNLKFNWYYDKSLYKKLFVFSGWNLFGNLAYIGKGQGTNMLLNVFFGTTVNAAYGIMTQVQNALNTFVAGFQSAITPQIIKNYANNNIERTMDLIYIGSKMSFFLLICLVNPILLNLHAILHFWLNNYPDKTLVFTQVILFNILIDSVSGSLMSGAQATGNIRNYQITIGILLFLNIPLNYLFFSWRNNPNDFLYISVFISLISLFFRLLLLRGMINLNIVLYTKNVLFPILIVSVYSFIIYFILRKVFNGDDLLNAFLSSIVFLFATIIGIYLLGLSKEEKKLVLSYVRR